MYGVETLGEKVSRVLGVKIPTITLKIPKESLQEKKERLTFLVEFQRLVNVEIGELFYQIYYGEKAKR